MTLAQPAFADPASHAIGARSFAPDAATTLDAAGWRAVWHGGSSARWVTDAWWARTGADPLPRHATAAHADRSCR